LIPPTFTVCKVALKSLLSLAETSLKSFGTNLLGFGFFHTILHK
jgi:hypothetical protein